MSTKGQAVRDGIIRPRRAGKATGTTGQFSIPAHMHRAIPEGATFRAEWHEDGILYRFLGIDVDTVDDPAAPEWTKNGKGTS